jgi:hypothetical protein
MTPKRSQTRQTTHRIIVLGGLVPIKRVKHDASTRHSTSRRRKKSATRKRTHLSSLRVDGFPNCVAIDLSKLKQLIHVRARFNISSSCCSVACFFGDRRCRSRSVAVLELRGRIRSQQYMCCTLKRSRAPNSEACV